MKLLPALLLMTACGTVQRRADCDYSAKVHLTEHANEQCHRYPMRAHNGDKVRASDEVLGCGNAEGIISNGTRSNIGHENGHVIEEICPEWAKGYFD